MHSVKSLVLILIVVASLGCGSTPTGTVTGKVLVNGTPTGGYEICFHSVKDGSTAVGAAGKDGQYILVQARTKEFAAGDYKVTLIPTSEIEGVPLPKAKIPKELASASTTTLIKTVGPGANVIDLEVSAQ